MFRCLIVKLRCRAAPLCLLFLALITAPLLSAQESPQQINNLRLWHSPDRTRVVFDVSADVQHSIFELSEPRRLVIDVENANLQMQLPSLDELNPHISAIRSGIPKPGVLRFVLELKIPVEHNSFVLSPNELYGHRLVVDLNDPLALALDSREAELKRALARESVTSGLEQSNPSASARSATPKDTLPETANAAVSRASVSIQPPVAKDRPLIVAIDAGHGGEDPGATGHRGTREKKLTLEIAKRLKKRINRDRRMRAVLIRTGDYYIELHKRRLAARKLNADIFISIHADAFRKKSARGFSVFALSQRGATSAMARALAAKENASDLIGGVSLADKDQVLAQVLVDLSMTNTISESVNLGGRVLNELGKLGKLHSKRVEQAGFAVLKSPDMPSILIETGFITNPEEERNLRSSRFQEKLVNAIYTAVDAYYQQTPHLTYASYSAPAIDTATDSFTSLVKPKSKARTASPQVHVVKRGESLSKISAQYNVTIRSLKRLNKIQRNTVYVGQQIKLPSGAKIPATRVKTHKVKRGDTLSEIALAYGSSIKKIMSANKLRSRTIMLGQTLKIPN